MSMALSDSFDSFLRCVRNASPMKNTLFDGRALKKRWKIYDVGEENIPLYKRKLDAKAQQQSNKKKTREQMYTQRMNGWSRNEKWLHLVLKPFDTKQQT